MSIKETLHATFIDPDGSLSIPELSATGAALLGLVTTGWDFFYRGHPVDLQALGIGAAAIVAALGAAQKLRDGSFRRDQQ